MKISLIQTSPQTDKAENLRVIRQLMEDAMRADSPDLIVLLEYFEYYGGSPEGKLAEAETAPDGANFANELGVCVHASTLMGKVLGEDIVAYNLDGFKVGCAICYGIRFAELYLALKKAGADIIVLPAAFTLQTGKDH